MTYIKDDLFIVTDSKGGWSVEVGNILKHSGIGTHFTRYFALTCQHNHDLMVNYFSKDDLKHMFGEIEIVPVNHAMKILFGIK